MFDANFVQRYKKSLKHRNNNGQKDVKKIKEKAKKQFL
jgi:hypothetical protein